MTSYRIFIVDIPTHQFTRNINHLFIKNYKIHILLSIFLLILYSEKYFVILLAKNKYFVIYIDIFFQYAFEVAAISAFGEIMEIEFEQIKDLYRNLEKGYNSYPVYVPGTSYWESIKVNFYFFLLCANSTIHIRVYVRTWQVYNIMSLIFGTQLFMYALN